MKATARPILSALRSRCYASQAAAEQASKDILPKGLPTVVRQPDGSIVAAVENNYPVVRLAVMYNAGSRYESKDTPGITHLVRHAGNLSTLSRTGFAVTKHLLQMGADLNITTTREHLIYSTNCLRSKMFECLDILRDVAVNPAYKSWEVRDIERQALKYDLAKYHTEPGTMLMEALHEVAFRDTLGNSLYMPEHKVGAYSYEHMRQFKEAFLTGANTAVVAVGAEPYEFAHHVEMTYGLREAPPSTAPTKVKATYHGGEKRIDMGIGLAHAAVVTQGASLGSKDLIPLAVLQRIMGVGPSIKYSDATASRISKAVSQVAKGPYSTNTININYSDSGLFGFYVVGQPDEMQSILKSAAAAFGNATKEAISDQELASAKNNLKAAVLLALDDGEHMLTEIGVQAMLTGEIVSAQQVCDEIDRTTVADVQTVAKKVINGKPSMVAIGNLAHTPYLDQIV